MIGKALIFTAALCAGVTTQDAQAATAKLHKIVGTAISANGVVTAVPTGTTVIDTQSIKCGDSNGCTISIAAMVQAISGSGSGQWQICALVDGNLALPGCPVQGVVPSSNYVVGNLRASAIVNSGTHTVVTEIVMPAAGSIAARESDYTVLKN
ncbi:MAG TPA: hypothetical protein VMF58_18090 [Rhizomicrobium sp.]|nr:hypothetical protein [Rhizomicrobium sp.]